MSSSHGYSANGFGDGTSQSRRGWSVSEDTDPSEHSYHSDDIADSSTRSVTSRSRSATPIPEPPSRSGYWTGVRVTARKSVPLPIRRTFTIPHRDEAGASRIRDRSVTPPPPPEDRAPVVPRTGMTPSEHYMFSGVMSEVQAHRMLVNHHEHSIDSLMNMMAANSESMDKIVELLVRARASVHRLYSLVFLLMAMMMIILGWMILWVRH